MRGASARVRGGSWLLATLLVLTVVAIAVVSSTQFHRPKPWVVLPGVALPFILAAVSPIRRPYAVRLLLVTVGLGVLALLLLAFLWLLRWLATPGPPTAGRPEVVPVEARASDDGRGGSQSSGCQLPTPERWRGSFRCT